MSQRTGAVSLPVDQRQEGPFLCQDDQFAGRAQDVLTKRCTLEPATPDIIAKALFAFSSRHHVEAVLIPDMPAQHYTACVSSQGLRILCYRAQCNPGEASPMWPS